MSAAFPAKLVALSISLSFSLFRPFALYLSLCLSFSSGLAVAQPHLTAASPLTAAAAAACHVMARRAKKKGKKQKNLAIAFGEFHGWANDFHAVHIPLTLEV